MKKSEKIQQLQSELSEVYDIIRYQKENEKIKEILYDFIEYI